MWWKDEWKRFLAVLTVFLGFFFLPVGGARFDHAVLEGLHLAKWYAREHVVLCLVPAFFIAGAIAVFVSKESVIKYFGARANKVLAYGVASVSGTILAVCSCTVLPLFAGIYKRGAGIGPATAFLYSGPAINVLAIILTARVLGLELGVARALGAVVFAVVIGLAMHALFRGGNVPDDDGSPSGAPSDGRPLWITALHFASMIGVIVFANWSRPAEPSGLWHAVYQAKWLLTAIFLASTVGLTVFMRKGEGEIGDWLESTWGFAKQILPLLLIGVVVAGALLGRPGEEGLLPSRWVARAVGGNSLGANLFASVAGAFMYFATLTEVPILQGLIGSGMGKGPALALLLAGPALSLPNMLVIAGVIGFKKTAAYVTLVIVMAAASGIVYGTFFG